MGCRLSRCSPGDRTGNAASRHCVGKAAKAAVYVGRRVKGHPTESSPSNTAGEVKTAEQQRKALTVIQTGLLCLPRNFVTFNKDLMIGAANLFYGVDTVDSNSH